MRKKKIILFLSIVLLANLTSCVEFGFLEDMEYAQNIDVQEIKVGTRVEVVAEPNPGFEFSHWSQNGEIVSNKELYVFTMPDREINLTANFSRK
jgi:hypothetical protein